MAKAKAKVVPLTREQDIAAKLAHATSDWAYDFIPAPSEIEPRHEIGALISLGGLENPTVAGVSADGKIYAIESLHSSRDEAPHLKISTYTWYSVFPAETSTWERKFSKENPFSYINYSQRDIEGLVSMKFHAGMDDTPAYQRELVWSDADREALLDSVFNCIDIGKFVVVKNEKHVGEGLPYFEIVDGKQRLNTLADFKLNKFAYRGVFYRDMTKLDRYAFDGHNISVAIVDRQLTEAQKVDLFLAVNTTGKAQTADHLDAVRAYRKTLA